MRSSSKRLRALLVLSSVALLNSSMVLGQEAPAWADVTVAAGVNFFQEPDPIVPYGGGTVWNDIDNDGWEDLFLTQFLGCSRVFRNLGDGTFERILPPGLESECNIETRGASMADYDNDGDQDLFLSVDGQNRLLRSDLIETGVLSFVDVTETAGFTSDTLGNSASAVWGDFNQDGFLDLFVTNHSPTISLLNCGLDELYLNRGDGTFLSVGDRMGVSSGASGRGCGLAATWSDYDEDGDLDLMVVNDFGHTFSPNRLFRNDGPGDGLPWRLTDVSFDSGFDFRMFGMGIGTGDYDRDGDFDYYMADIGDNNLAQNQGDGTFIDQARHAGVRSNDINIYQGGGLVSWGGVFADFDRDGWEDLLVSNGGAPVSLYPNMFGEDYINLNPVHMYRNLRNGKFSEVHEKVGLGSRNFHRSVGVADFDQDGDLDLHFGMIIGENYLYRQDAAPEAHWLQVKARGTLSNRDGFGTRLQIESGPKSQIRETNGGSSFLTNNSRYAFFGLGQLDTVERLEATFLSGAQLELFDVAADQFLEVVEPLLDLQATDTRTLTLTNRSHETLEAQVRTRNRQLSRTMTIGAGKTEQLHHSLLAAPGIIEVVVFGQVMDQAKVEG